MKKHLLSLLFLFASPLVWLQAEAQNDDEIDMTDVIVIEDVEPTPPEPTEEPNAVVEIPEVEVEGASMDVDAPAIPETPEGPTNSETPEAPTIPEATNELADETEVVLEIPGQEDQVLGEATMASEETISVDFPDEDVRTILRNVADLFELNLVIPDTLQGRTSVKLRNVTWRQVFEVVLEPLGFTYVEDRNIIRVKSTEELTTEPVDTRVFELDFAEPSAVVASLGPLVDTSIGGSIIPDEAHSLLIITERPTKMNKIQDLIGRIDKAAKTVNSQVMIETKFIEVTKNDVKDIGVNWASLKDYSLRATELRREWERERFSEDAISSESVNNEGFSSENGLTFDDSSRLAENLTRLASTGRTDTAVFSATNFEILLSALAAKNNSKLVSNPTVITMSNKPAVIDIVTEDPQIEFEFNPETGTREANGLADPLTFGTKLTVEPRVTLSGHIDLEITPEVSNQIGTKETPLGPQPILSKRTLTTNVKIKDGFTVALGGLIENVSTDSSTKVPLLGDLPGVGRLFRSSSVDEQQRNLIIFITAKTLDADGSTYKDIVDPRTLDEMSITPSELPGYKVPEEQKELLRKLEDYRVESEMRQAKEEAKVRIKQIEAATREAEEERASEKRR